MKCNECGAPIGFAKDHPIGLGARYRYSSAAKRLEVLDAAEAKQPKEPVPPSLDRVPRYSEFDNIWTRIKKMFNMSSKRT